MLGVSAGQSDRAPAAGEGQESGGASGGSSEVGGPSPINPGGGGLEESDRSGVGGGNRWPRQETLALLKIRSDMDAVFRDASLKGPLWEEVSRKLAELGFKRSAKKCKEKFENVYKYYKRTKDGRSSKPDGKSYRFFDQLEAFEATAAPPPPRPPPMSALLQQLPPPPPNLQIPTTITVSSATSPTPLTIIPPIPNNPIITMTPSPFPPQTTAPPPLAAVPPMMHAPYQSSSSTSSDEDMQLRQRRRSGGRKRKWKDYFEGLVGEVVQKQEEMQNRFLEALERRERERAARDELWRAQEAARMSREHELLAQERSAAAVKDKAMLALLQKVAHEHNLQIPIFTENQSNPPLWVVENSQPLPTVPSSRQPPAAAQTEARTLGMIDMDVNISGGGGGEDIGVMQATSSRWPKAEVQALIKLRTGLDVKYQENGPKGPLWEEISAAMGKMGYSRNAKRCKEKWENINKYYKKVKESNKRRPEDSKTCPYFNQLEEIYKERALTHVGGVPEYGLKTSNAMPPIMARPEQQWPLSQPQQQQGDSLMMHGNESNHIQEDDEEEDDDLDDDEDEGGAYEIMASKQQQQQQPSSLANAAE